MPKATVYTESLCRAANAVGGADVLAQRLQVTIKKLRRWMRGDEDPPMDVFLRAVDLLEKHHPSHGPRTTP